MMTEKELLRWGLADHAFLEADALAQHVIEQGIFSGSSLFSACVAGIAVSYCRPFMSGDGLGPLPNEMKQFGGPQELLLHGTHLTLFEARHTMAAHFDRLHNEELYLKGEFKFSPSEVILDLTKEGVEVTTSGAHLTANLILMARALFAYQRERVGQKLGGYGAYLRDKHGRYGKHIFKVPERP